MAETVRDEQFEGLLAFIRDERGFDFTGYKRPSLQRRIAKRMQDLGVESFGEYQSLLAGDGDDEFVQLFNTVLINVTSFFRDEVAWDFLAESIVPKLLEAKEDNEPIRVWSTGCASGEEAYTLAMVLAERLGVETFRARVKIYATDVDEEALTQGRHGSYDEKTVEPVPEQLREKYFERVNSSFVFRSDLRRSVIFGRHDLIHDPPISRVDLLVSRNTLMYFDADTQEQILRSFHFALRDHGALFLGKAEAIANRSQLFAPIDLKRRVFAKVPRDDAPPRAVRADEDGHELSRIAAQALIQEAGYEAAPVAQLVVDPAGKLALANLQARMFFSLAPRDIGRPIQDLEVSFRPVELRSRIEQAYTERHAITMRDVEWRVGEDVRFVDVQVVPLVASTGDVVGAGITFTDVTRYQRLQQALTESKREVETAYEELQSTVEELETTNEELQSTNEELETTNEELQSTNEELETMNEELQSTNEELSTINDELQQRTDELNETNAYLEGILGSLSAAVVVLDRELGVRNWNQGARELWGLIEDEVRGKNFLNLDIGLPVDQLRTPIRRVLAQDGQQQFALPAVNRRGRQVQARITITPLGADADPRGVILMMEGVED